MAVGIEEDLRAAHGGQAGRFGIPLIPADQHADAAEPRVPGTKTQVAGGEVKFFVVLRVIGDVHLPVLAEHSAVGVDDGRGVVIQSLGPLLEQRRDDDHAELGGQLAEQVGGGSRDGLGQAKKSWSSVWQKYWLRKSSCRQMIWAPRPAASRIPRTAFCMFAAGSWLQLICTNPRVTVWGRMGSAMRG